MVRESKVHDWRREAMHHVLGQRLVCRSDQRGLIPGVINGPGLSFLEHLDDALPIFPD